MAEMVEIKVQIDSELKAEAEFIIKRSGLTMESAIQNFLKKCVSKGKIAYEFPEKEDDDWDNLNPPPEWAS